MGTLGLLITLVVRLYDNGGLAAGDRAAVIAEATAILVASDIGTTWPECPGPKPQPAPAPPPHLSALTCDRPIGGAEIAIRLVRGETSRHARGPLSLGYSLVDTNRKTGTLATIYLDRVEWLARASGVDARILLSRAIAHEIGHLLLGTNTHARTGLMRAVWSQEALQRQLPEDWTFAPRDAMAMRRALRRDEPVVQTADNIVRANQLQ